MLTPLLWMVVTSISTTEESRQFPPGLPHSIQWSNFVDVWTGSPFRHWLLNTAIVSVIVVISNLVLCSMAGYAFARLRFRGSGLVFILLLATLMVPFQVVLDPDAPHRQVVRVDRPSERAGRAEPRHRVRGVPDAAVLRLAATRSRRSRPHRRREPARCVHQDPSALDGSTSRDPRDPHVPRHLERLPVATRRDPEPPAHDDAARPVDLPGRAPHRLAAADGRDADEPTARDPALLAGQRVFVRSIASSGIK